MRLNSLFLVVLLTTFSFSTVITAQPYRSETPPSDVDRWHNYSRDAYLGIRFGLDVGNVRYRGTGGLAQTNPITRFHLGFVAGRKLGDGLPFFIESGLIYVEKGTEIDATQEYQLRKINLKYFEVPIVLKYKIETPLEDFTIQPIFGGFMALGLGGKTKLYEERRKVRSFSPSRYKRFDSGIRLGCGLAYQNFYFEMTYDIGLFNIAGSDYADYHYDNFDGHIRTGDLSLTFGVDF